MRKCITLAWLLVLVGCSDAETSPPQPQEIRSVCEHDGDPCHGTLPSEEGTCRAKAWAMVCCYGCWDGYTCQPGTVPFTCGRRGEMCSTDKCSTS